MDSVIIVRFLCFPPRKQHQQQNVRIWNNFGRVKNGGWQNFVGWWRIWRLFSNGSMILLEFMCRRFLFICQIFCKNMQTRHCVCSFFLLLSIFFGQISRGKWNSISIWMRSKGGIFDNPSPVARRLNRNRWHMGWVKVLFWLSQSYHNSHISYNLSCDGFCIGVLWFRRKVRPFLNSWFVWFICWFVCMKIRGKRILYTTHDKYVPLFFLGSFRLWKLGSTFCHCLYCWVGVRVECVCECVSVNVVCDWECGALSKMWYRFVWIYVNGFGLLQ